MAVTATNSQMPPSLAPDAAAAANRAAARTKARRNTMLGLAFLAPNILGFLTFTALPLVFSMVLAFSNWDLTLHNHIRAQELERLNQPPETIQFVGLTNFIRLFRMEDFYRFLGNTLFFMMGLPFAIAASLISAIMLSKDLRGGGRRAWALLIIGAILVSSILMLVAVGAAATGMTLLVGGVACTILILGVAGGTSVYRTLFYLPHFTAGVATYLLWKKLYNPTSGPITNVLTPPLQWLTSLVNYTPAGLWQGGTILCLVLAGLLVMFAGRRLRFYWEDGDLGWGGAAISLVLMVLPTALMLRWYGAIGSDTTSILPDGRNGLAIAAWVFLAAVVLMGLWQSLKVRRADRRFVTRSPMEGVGSGLMLCAATMVGQLVLIGLAAVCYHLPQWAVFDPAQKLYGLTTPNWLDDVAWAKPSIMLMGFWGAIGSNNMLLYLAALTNVPQDLYEAADIDGANRFQKFWNITWPQLAPTTFFIVIMGVIYGLQGGFEMARVMTQGGPAGSTTTLAYFIYNEGFETGRLGFSSAVAWTLFLMVLLVTLFNWKFGNKYVND